jgi:hypothetical protein
MIVERPVVAAVGMTPTIVFEAAVRVWKKVRLDIAAFEKSPRILLPTPSMEILPPTCRDLLIPTPPVVDMAPVETFIESVPLLKAVSVPKLRETGISSVVAWVIYYFLRVPHERVWTEDELTGFPYY